MAVSVVGLHMCITCITVMLSKDNLDIAWQSDLTFFLNLSLCNFLEVYSTGRVVCEYFLPRSWSWCNHIWNGAHVAQRPANNRTMWIHVALISPEPKRSPWGLKREVLCPSSPQNEQSVQGIFIFLFFLNLVAVCCDTERFWHVLAQLQKASMVWAMSLHCKIMVKTAYTFRFVIWTFNDLFWSKLTCLHNTWQLIISHTQYNSGGRWCIKWKIY